MGTYDDELFVKKPKFSVVSSLAEATRLGGYLFAVKLNTISHDPHIHHMGCRQIERNGGGPGKYGQVSWGYFKSYDEAMAWAESRGYTPDKCRYCW